MTLLKLLKLSIFNNHNCRTLYYKNFLRSFQSDRPPQGLYSIIIAVIFLTFDCLRCCYFFYLPKENSKGLHFGRNTAQHLAFLYRIVFFFSPQFYWYDSWRFRIAMRCERQCPLLHGHYTLEDRFLELICLQLSPQWPDPSHSRIR